MAPLLLVALAGCGSSEEAPAPGAWTEQERALLADLRLRTEPRPDPTNRFADVPQAAALGQVLFFDAHLSPTATVSCATCHDPDRHFTDGLALAKGLGTAARHTPTIPGSQWGPWFFWDGRADSLWAQALGPIEDPAEMGSDRGYVARHVLDAHRDGYEAVFGPAPEVDDLPAQARPGTPGGDALDPARREVVDRIFANVGKAIAAYERTLVPTEAPFDRYVDAVLAGDPGGGAHLDEGQVRGLSLFLREGCVDCHHGPMLTDRAFHNLGLPEPTAGFDPGRTRGAVTVLSSPFACTGPYSDTEDCPELRYLDPDFQDFRGAFKTPTLRNVAETAPYMHNGIHATLEEVVDFYSTLPTEPLLGHRELTLRPLELAPGQIEDLVAFLGALSGEPLPAEQTAVPDAARHATP